MPVEKISFSAVGTLVTMHPGDTSQPFPDNLLSQPNLDLFVTNSFKNGFTPIFLNNGDIDLHVANKSPDELFTQQGIHDIPVGYGMELIALQIKYLLDRHVYHLKTKIDLNFEKLINDFLMDHPDYESEDFESWLNWYQRDEYYEKGINFLSKLREFNEDLYVSEILQHITDPDCGLRAQLETEIDNDNITRINKKYGDWPEDIVLVMNGKFHIELDITDDKLGFNLKAPSEVLSIFVRNYDEDPV